MITLLAATLFGVQFSGGMPNDFVAALSKGTGQNVVLSMSEAQIVSKAEFETDDLTEMARAIRKQTAFAILPGTDLILSDQLLAKRLVQGTVYRGAPVKMPRPQAATTTFVGLPHSAVKDGKVTFATEDTDALQVQKLGGSFSKPVKFHWIYQELPIYVHVKDMPELDFLKWVAKSVGARLIATANEYSFDLDPSEIRKRAVAAITANARPVVGRKEDVSIVQETQNFRIACINTLTPAQLTEALASQGAMAKIELGPRSSLTNLALNRVRSLQQYQESIPKGTAGPKSAIGLMQKIDPSRKAYLIVDSRFTVFVEVPILDKDGKPAGSLRL